MMSKNHHLLARLFIFLLLFICILGYFQGQSIKYIFSKLDSVKQGMTEEEVIKILGKPENIEGKESSKIGLSEEIKKLNGNVYIFRYKFKTIANKMFLDMFKHSKNIICSTIVFNKNSKKVIVEIERTLGDVGLIRQYINGESKFIY